MDTDPPTPTPIPTPPVTPGSQKLTDVLQSNVLWFALSLVITTVTAMTGALLFLEGRVEKQVTLLVPVKLTEEFYGDPWVNERRSAEKDARESHDQATRVELQARNAYAEAQKLVDDARRLAAEFTTKTEQFNAALDLTKVTSRIDAALADPSFRQLVISRVLPVGAIIPFDVSTGCPEGWSRFERAGGRTLIGAGPHTNLDRSGRPISSYQVGQFGGRRAAPADYRRA